MDQVDTALVETALADTALVDTRLYPIDRPDSDEYRALVEQSAASFGTDGVVALPDFIQPQAVAAIAAEANEQRDQAFFCHNSHDVYLGEGELKTDVGSIANDLLDENGVLQRLYDWEPLAPFIADVVGHEQLYRSADPLGAVSINVYGQGHGHDWHFDEAPFSVTIMIQEADTDGHFEYVPGIRDQPIEIDRLLAGDSHDVRRLPFAAGTLSILGGRETIHRVSPVNGDSYRFVPVLTYATEPGSVNSHAVRELFWGRSS